MSEIIHLAPGQALEAATLRRIADAAKACKIIAFPTDTVYGIGSTGLIKAATRRMYQIKARSALKPLPILVPSAEEARRWVIWTPAAEALARRFWPGGLTLVPKTTAEGKLLTFPEYTTLAIRAPNHPVALSLLEASGIPWAVTSANISGRPALIDGKSVAEQLGGLLDYVIDSGPVAGTESTVVDATATPVRILRQGSITAEMILDAVGQATT